MKNILNFLRESEELSREILCNIYGGHQTVSTSHSDITTDKYGRCVQENMTDSFVDINGDGIWNEALEVGQESVSYSICQSS